MNNTKIASEQQRWELIARENKNKKHIDELLGRLKRNEFISFLRKHSGPLENKVLLKTDLREEAFGEDQVLFCDEFKRVRCFGLDIALPAVAQAKIKAKEKADNKNFFAADIRNVPVADNIFDLVISTSTLDHFAREEDLKNSLLEIKRILKPQGKAIITLNNKLNLNFFLMLKLERLLKLTSYPVNFFSPKDVQRALSQTGLKMAGHDFIVNIISPANSGLILIRRLLGDKAAGVGGNACIKMSRWLSRGKLKALSAWFIVFVCVKE